MAHVDANIPGARPFSSHLDRPKAAKTFISHAFFELAQFLQIFNIPLVLPPGHMKQLSH
jgi:hypothetical protein